MACFSDFQYGFRSSRSTADVVTVVSDRISRAFNRSGATQAVSYPRLLTGFGRLVFFTNLSLMEFRVRYLALLLLFSVIDGFEWFSSQEDPVNAGVPQGSFLVLHFSCCILLTFLMMLCVILQSMLMIPLSILSVIRHLIHGNNFNWLLNLNLIYETL